MRNPSIHKPIAKKWKGTAYLHQSKSVTNSILVLQEKWTINKETPSSETNTRLSVLFFLKATKKKLLMRRENVTKVWGSVIYEKDGHGH